MSEFTDMLGRGQLPYPTVRTQLRLDDGSWEQRDEVLRTKDGTVLTEDDIAALADEAERGYDVSLLRARPVRMPSEAAGGFAVPAPGHFADNLLAVRSSMAAGFRRRRRAPITLALRRLWRFLLGWGPRLRPVHQITHPLSVHASTLGLGFQVLEQHFDGDGNRIIGKVRLLDAAGDARLLWSHRAEPMTDEQVADLKRRWEAQFAPAASPDKEGTDG